ncbi:MAG TPA: glycine cleavage system protein GcvH [Chloroflexia bacterium]|jgi:glycine cleavage system H protein|nr:glycine cleavage system protein GcvH [Chloroflexia bacterium]
MENPRDNKYTNEHEWVQLDGEDALVGITNYAATQLGDMVYVDMPTIGVTVAKGEAIGALESVKAAADFYSPLSGEVVARNEALLDEPGLMNSDPFTSGWFLRIKPADPTELDDLMDAEAYDEFEKSQG